MNYYFMRVNVHCNIIIHSVTDIDIRDICEKYVEVKFQNISILRNIDILRNIICINSGLAYPNNNFIFH